MIRFQNWDWRKMEMEEVIVGIKELVDGGLREVPPIYVRPPSDRPTGYNSIDYTNLPSQVQIPIIDISSLLPGATHDEPNAHSVIQQIAYACKEWGFFQVPSFFIHINNMFVHLSTFFQSSICDVFCILTLFRPPLLLSSSSRIGLNFRGLGFKTY